MIAKKHLKCIGQYLVAYHIDMFVCMSYLKLPSRGDHHLITSSNQLAKSDGHLIVPPVELIPSWLQPQVVVPSIAGIIRMPKNISKIICAI